MKKTLIFLSLFLVSSLAFAASDTEKVIDMRNADTVYLGNNVSATSNVVVSSEIDTMSELDTIVADANVLSAEEINTFAELQAIVADKTLVETTTNISTQVSTAAQGWVAASAADQSCETTCGIANPLVAIEATSGLFVATDSATADSCICDGAIA